MQITLFRGEDVLLRTCDMWLPFVSVPLSYILKLLTTADCRQLILMQFWSSDTNMEQRYNVFTEIFAKT